MIDPDAFPKPYCDLGALHWLRLIADDKGKAKASFRRMATAWGWSLAKVQRRVEAWEKSRVLKRKTIQGQNVFTLVFVAEIHEFPVSSDTPSDTPEADLFSGVEIIPIRTQKQATRLPETWRLTKPLGLWAMERGFTETEVRREAERFRLHWLGASGKSAVKKSWDAAWRTWIMNAEDRRQRNAGATEGALAEMREKYGR